MKTFKQYLMEMALRNPERAGLLFSRLRGVGLDQDTDVDPIIPKKRVGSGKIFKTEHGLVGPSWKRKSHNLTHYDEWTYLEKHGKTKNVPIKSIVTRQDHINPVSLKKKLTGKDEHNDPEIPYAYHHDGTHYLIDGNHRVNAARLKGETHIKIRVADGQPIG